MGKEIAFHSYMKSIDIKNRRNKETSKELQES